MFYTVKLKDNLFYIQYLHSAASKWACYMLIIKAIDNNYNIDKFSLTLIIVLKLTFNACNLSNQVSCCNAWIIELKLIVNAEVMTI